jgi:hypothetical protein
LPPGLTVTTIHSMDPGGILAHTFYPVPINPESIAGDMHQDADENCHSDGDTDIYSVALHEAGHALGLSHSDKPGDVMYPYYRRDMTLSANDIGAVQQLYGTPSGTTPTGAPSTPAAPPTRATPSEPAPLHPPRQVPGRSQNSDFVALKRRDLYNRLHAECIRNGLSRQRR